MKFASKTPFSLLINLILFVSFALLYETFVTIILQGMIIFISFFAFGIKYREIPVRDFIRLLPVVLFVFMLNCFRGGGEIIFRFGPFVLLRQGILRGAYYSIVIAELFMMSKLITKGFPSNQIISTMYSIDAFIFKKIRFQKRFSKPPVRNFFLILFYVLKIFQITYSELRLFFKTGTGSLKNKILQFFNTVFKKSLNEYEKIGSISIVTLKPVFLDYLYIAVQVVCLTSAFFIKRWKI